MCISTLRACKPPHSTRRDRARGKLRSARHDLFPGGFQHRTCMPPPACSLHLNTSALLLARQVQRLVTDRGRRTAGGTQSCRGPGSQPATQPGYHLWLGCGMSQTSHSPYHRSAGIAKCLQPCAVLHCCCRPRAFFRVHSCTTHRRCIFLCLQLHAPLSTVQLSDGVE